MPFNTATSALSSTLAKGRLLKTATLDATLPSSLDPLIDKSPVTSRQPSPRMLDWERLNPSPSAVGLFTGSIRKLPSRTSVGFVPTLVGTLTAFDDAVPDCIR